VLNIESRVHQGINIEILSMWQEYLGRFRFDCLGSSLALAICQEIHEKFLKHNLNPIFNKNYKEKTFPPTILYLNSWPFYT
jgi:hypothetical protein